MVRHDAPYMSYSSLLVTQHSALGFQHSALFSPARTASLSNAASSAASSHQTRGPLLLLLHDRLRRLGQKVRIGQLLRDDGQLLFDLADLLCETALLSLDIDYTREKT